MKLSKLGLAVSLIAVLLISGSVGANVNGVPVDIPGTDVNFFLYRYEGPNPPYDEINKIWERLSEVFAAWVEAGQKPGNLKPEDVTVQVENGQPGVYIKDVLIVQPDQFHAEINRASREQLAEKWAANLRKGVEVFVQTNLVKR